MQSRGFSGPAEATEVKGYRHFKLPLDHGSAQVLLSCLPVPTLLATLLPLTSSPSCSPNPILAAPSCLALLLWR